MSASTHSFNLRAAAIKAFSVCWVLEASMNAIFGFRRGGGFENFVPSFGYAAVFVAIAFIAAWLPTEFVAIRGKGPKDWSAWLKRLGLAIPIAACFILSQVAGWAVMGVTLADGQLIRETKADATDTLRDELARKRAQLKNLGSQQSPDQIQAAIAKELAGWVSKGKNTVGALTRNCADPGWAPAVCRRVKVLEEQLAGARNADKLPNEIAELVRKIEKAPKVAKGSPDTTIIATITSATEADVQFWFPVFIVLVVGFFANFGFAIASMRAGGDGPASYQEPPSPASPRALPPPGPAGPAPGGAWPAAEHYSPVQMSGMGRPASEFSGGPRADGIHIHNHVGGGPSSTTPATSAGGRTTPPAANLATRRQMRMQQRPAPGAEPAVEATPLVPTPDAPRRPVDRDHVNRILDHLLVFQAACLKSVAGKMATADEVWSRYEGWSGGRQQVTREAFGTMLPLIGVDRVDLGGVPHFLDVEIRGATQVAVVGG